MTASEREPAAVRIAAAAALPVVAVTLYFTFSRGGIAVAIAGTALYLVLAHPRGLVGALAAVAVPLAVALHGAYGADLLAQYNYSGTDARAAGPLAAPRGDRAARSPPGCCAGWRCASTGGSSACRSPRGRGRSRSARRASPRCSRSSFATVAFDLPDRIADQRRAFVEGNAPPGGADLRTRLTKVGNNGRLAIWRVALREARAEPVEGRRRGHVPARVGARPRPPVAAAAASSTDTRSTTRCGPSSGGSASRCCWWSSRCRSAVGDPPLWGPERHVHAAFLAAGGGAAAPRDGRLGLGDARALRLVLRRRRARSSRRRRWTRNARTSRGG